MCRDSMLLWSFCKANYCCAGTGRSQEHSHKGRSIFAAGCNSAYKRPACFENQPGIRPAKRSKPINFDASACWTRIAVAYNKRQFPALPASFWHVRHRASSSKQKNTKQHLLHCSRNSSIEIALLPKTKLELELLPPAAADAGQQLHFHGKLLQLLQNKHQPQHVLKCLYFANSIEQQLPWSAHACQFGTKLLVALDSLTQIWLLSQAHNNFMVLIIICGGLQLSKLSGNCPKALKRSAPLLPPAAPTPLCSNSCQMLVKWLVSSLQSSIAAARASPTPNTTAATNSNGSINCNGNGNINAAATPEAATATALLSSSSWPALSAQAAISAGPAIISISNLSEQDLTILTIQYCNNLLNIGVLKQLSEKNNLDTFNPFHMYQWTHSEAPTSQPLTPGKLDKAAAWPYSSTPTATNANRILKGIQPDAAAVAENHHFDYAQQQVLRKRLLACSTLSEVHEIVNEMLPAGESLRRPSKRFIQLTELLNASDVTIFEVNRKKSLTSAESMEEVPRRNSMMKDANIQTDLHIMPDQAEVCCFCGRNDSGLGTDKNESGNEKPSTKSVGTETETAIQHAAKESNAIVNIPPPPPPPPPVAILNSVVPPPPPGGCAAAPPPPPPPPLPMAFISKNAVAAPPLPPPPPPPNGAITTAAAAPSTPPGTSKTPSTPTTPAPLPNPAECGWFNQANAFRKNAVNPPKPMKPLYWTRIIMQAPPAASRKIKPAFAATETDSNNGTPDEPSSTAEELKTAPAKEIWQEIDETSLDNIDEFTELFSRQAVAPIVKPKEKREVRAKSMKVLDSKRSQNVGIVARSLHVDFHEIEHAIYHVDTSVVSLETLQQIIHLKASDDELERIKEAAQSDLPLDYPEMFLLKIAQISMSTERISCIVFQAEFEEAATAIERKLEIVLQLSQFLIESEDLKLVFTIILTLGNYMNGGNRQRGQADGFTLEILGKLKDVKSKDSHTTLLHFIVRTYIERKRKMDVPLREIPLPTPEPADVERAVQVDFEEVKKSIMELNRKLSGCRNTTEKVILCSNENIIEPFKSKMENFLVIGRQTIQKLHNQLDECRIIFSDTMRFYHFTPKSRALEQCTPDQFFEYWTNFTNDFKDIWKKEIAMLWDDLLKKAKSIQLSKHNKNAKLPKEKAGDLKVLVKRLIRKESSNQ